MTTETNELMCENCHVNYWRPAICPGDSGRHHHGGIHTRDGRLIRVCAPCYDAFEKEWNEFKEPKHADH